MEGAKAESMTEWIRPPKRPNLLKGSRKGGAERGVRPYLWGPNTGSGRTLTVPEPKTKHLMLLLVQLTEGTA